MRHEESRINVLDYNNEETFVEIKFVCFAYYYDC